MVEGCADGAEENVSDRESSRFGGDGLNAERPVSGDIDVVDKGGKFPEPKKCLAILEGGKVLRGGESGLSSTMGFRSGGMCCGGLEGDP